MKIIPKKVRIKLEIFPGLSLLDTGIFAVFAGVALLLFVSNLHIALKLILGVVLILIFLLCVFKNGTTKLKGYQTIGSLIIYLAAQKRFKKSPAQPKEDIKQIIPFSKIDGSRIEYINGDFGAVIEITPSNFHYIDDDEQEAILADMGELFKDVGAHTLIKLEKPLDLSENIGYSKRLLETLEKEKPADGEKQPGYFAREYILKNNIEQLTKINNRENEEFIVKQKQDHFYLVLYDTDAAAVSNKAGLIQSELLFAGLESQILNDKQLACFIKACFDTDFDYSAVENVEPDKLLEWALPDELGHTAKMIINGHKKYYVSTVIDYPVEVFNGWGYSLFNLPSTRITVHSTPVDQERGIRMIDTALIELRRRSHELINDKDSKQNKVLLEIQTLEVLLDNLTNGNERLHFLTYYVLADEGVDREVSREYRRCEMKMSSLWANQLNGFFATLPVRNDLFSSFGRDVNTSSYAAMYPYISNALNDAEGQFLGYDSQLNPVFFDQNIHHKRNKIGQKIDKSRKNANMFVVGEPGGGKTYFIKNQIGKALSQGDKVVVCDPEAEYLYLGRLFGGTVIDIGGNKADERINPFHVIPPLKEDEEEDNSVEEIYKADVESMLKFLGHNAGDYNFRDYSKGSYDENPLNAHRQFLNSFFQLAMPGLDVDAASALDGLIGKLYKQKGITNSTDFSSLKAADYPVFDDLLALIDKEIQPKLDKYTLGNLKKLRNFVSNFSEGGLNANVWNGPSTLEIDNDFVVFNFRGILANKNSTVANAQMLLVMRFIENLAIQNREYNNATGSEKHIWVIIDEAHTFIHEERPVALDFMYQQGKRLRKYLGGLIPATQNFKDFIGRSEEVGAKASAVIKCCQYKAVFSLSPSDITELKEMYSDALRFTDAELDTVKSLTQGEMFFIINNRKRMKVSVKILPDEEMFVRAV